MRHLRAGDQSPARKPASRTGAATRMEIFRCLARTSPSDPTSPPLPYPSPGNQLCLLLARVVVRQCGTRTEGVLVSPAFRDQCTCQDTCVGSSTEVFLACECVDRFPVHHVDRPFFLTPTSTSCVPPPTTTTPSFATDHGATCALVGPRLAHPPSPVLHRRPPHRRASATRLAYSGRREPNTPRSRSSRLFCGSPAVGWCPRHGCRRLWPPGCATGAATVASAARGGGAGFG